MYRRGFLCSQSFIIALLSVERVVKSVTYIHYISSHAYVIICIKYTCIAMARNHMETVTFLIAVALLFYVHGKHLRSCRDGQLT